MDPAKERRLGERLFLVITLFSLTAWGVSQILFGERIPPGDGQGWDGRLYVWMVQDFRGVVLGGKLDSYWVQRILPPSVVYAALQTFGVPPADHHIVRGFALLNLALLLGTLLLWNGICRALDVSLAGRWLGFLLVFLNFACLKTPFYIPVMTDHTALFLGALLVYGHARGSVTAMALALFLGAFTWPSFLVLGGLLLCFPRAPLPDAPGAARHRLVAAGVGAFFLLDLALNLWDPVPYGQTGEVMPVDRSLLALSLPVALAYVMLGFGFLFRHPALFRLETFVGGLDRRRLAVWLLLLLGVSGAGAWLASGRPASVSIENYVRWLSVVPVLKPALWLLAHVVYLGLLPLLLAFFWPGACRAAHRLGLGFTLFTAALLLQSLNVSRLLLHGLVPLALLAVLALEGVRLPRWAPWLLTGLALFVSKAWFAINHEGFLGKAPALSYPAQYYFMNFPLWMAPEMYALQGAVALVASLLVALVRLRAREMTPEEAAAVHPGSRRLLRTTLGWGAALLVAALVEAGAGRALERQRASDVEEPSVTRADPALGWVNVPRSEGRLRFQGREVSLKFNSYGLRGPDYGHAKAAGVRRVLLLGGSLAEAATVPEEASLRAQLEARLDGLGCGSVEVINGAVARYGLAQQSRFFSMEGARYAPDLVVEVFGHADLVDALRSPDPEAEEEQPDPAAPRLPRRFRNPPRRPLYPWHGSAALRLLSNLTLDHAPSLHRWLALTGLVERSRPPVELRPFAIREDSDATWEASAGLLATLADDVRSHGASFAVVHGPALFEVDEAAWNQLLQRYQMSPRFWRRERVARRLRAAAEEAGAPLVELRESFARARLLGTQLYRPEDGSWTAPAHALAAETLAPDLLPLLGCPTGRPG